MKKNILYVGLDVHKFTIDIAISENHSSSPARSYGQIDNRLGVLDRVVRKLQSRGSELQFVYEAGPCGYQIYRHLSAKGLACSILAPSLIPRRPGDRIKTDRRDAINLVRLFQAGELSSIYIPGIFYQADRWYKSAGCPSFNGFYQIPASWKSCKSPEVFCGPMCICCGRFCCAGCGVFCIFLLRRRT